MDDKDKQLPDTGDDGWMDELFTTPEHGDELQPDEQAISAAGLTHPNDAELERILQEARDQGWVDPPR